MVRKRDIIDIGRVKVRKKTPSQGRSKVHKSNRRRVRLAVMELEAMVAEELIDGEVSELNFHGEGMACPVCGQHDHPSWCEFYGDDNE